MFKKVFYGWRVVAVCGVLNALGGGIHFYGFTVFFLPISQDLGISRAATSLVFSLSRAEGAFEGPIAGFFVDRRGPRLVLIVGTLVMGVGYLILSQVQSYLGFLLVYMVLIAMGYGAAFQQATMAAVNNWFVRRRALAMSVVISAFGLGGAIVSPMLSAGVQQLGWRSTAFIAGLVIIAITTPLSLLVPRSPESKGLVPDGEPLPSNNGVAVAEDCAAVASSEPEFSAREAMRTAAFWHLTLATTLRVAAIGSLLVHFVPILVWKGLDQQSAALYLSALALLGIPVRLALGYFGDRLHKAGVVSITMLVGAASILLVLLTSNVWYLVAFVLLLAIVEGSSPVNWAMLGDYFGRKSFGTIRGMMGLVYPWGMIVGPVFAGGMYDRLQSYSEVLWVIAAVFVLAAISFALLKGPKPRVGG
ncbi:MAG: MFS transporter [Chloroflexota bacterium]